MTAAFTLVDTSGSTHVLGAASGVYLLRGAKGLGGPSLAVNEDKLPYAPGTRLRRLSTPPARLDLPIEIRAASVALLDTLMDTLRGWVLPGTEASAEPETVFLRCVRDDGASREIEGIYVGGLEGDEAAGGTLWQKAVLSLYCSDPYWRDTAETEVTFTNGVGLRLWFPLYPYDLSPSAVFAEQTITNTGQVETWPVWTITGPGSDPTLTNLTTGEVLALDLTLADGDVVTIDTNERGATAKTITNQNDVNLWPFASATSVLWPLQRGANEIRVAMSGTSGDSAIELAYRRRWAGGYR